jgi:hypothetical protein
MKDLIESLKLILEDFLLWLDCLGKPYVTCRKVLRKSSSEKMVQFLRLWLVYSLISLTLQFPVYSIVGIDVKNVGFHLPNLLLLLLMQLLLGLAVHIGLRIYKIPSKFADTLTIYSVMIGSFSPFINLLIYPVTISAFQTLKSIKLSNPNFQEALKKYFESSQIPEHFSFVYTYTIVIAPFLGLLSFLLITLFSRMVAERYHSEKYRTFSAINFSIYVLNIIPLFFLILIYHFVVYVFISSN